MGSVLWFRLVQAYDSLYLRGRTQATIGSDLVHLGEVIRDRKSIQTIPFTSMDSRKTTKDKGMERFQRKRGDRQGDLIGYYGYQKSDHYLAWNPLLITRKSLSYLCSGKVMKLTNPLHFFPIIEFSE